MSYLQFKIHEFLKSYLLKNKFKRCKLVLTTKLVSHFLTPEKFKNQQSLLQLQIDVMIYYTAATSEQLLITGEGFHRKHLSVVTGCTLCFKQASFLRIKSLKKGSRILNSQYSSCLHIILILLKYCFSFFKKVIYYFFYFNQKNNHEHLGNPKTPQIYLAKYNTSS